MWWIILLMGLTSIPIIIMEKAIYTNQNNIQINIIYTFITVLFLFIYDLVFNPQHENKKCIEIFKEYRNILNKGNVFIFLIILGVIVSFRYWLYYHGFINYDVKLFLPILGTFSIMISFLVGILYFKENWNNYNILGIIMALSGILLISYKTENRKIKKRGRT